MMPTCTQECAAEEAELLAAEDGSLPDESWESVKALPPFPTPSRCELCAERSGGCLLVGMIIAFCVSCVMLTTGSAVPSAVPIATFCRYLVCTEAIVALSFLFALQYLGLGAIERTPETCFPLPEVIADRLRRDSRAAVLGRRALSDGNAPLVPVAVPATERTLAYRLRAAVEGQGNVHDPAGVRGVYCVRCFVWRSEDGHHCSECQRCVPEFDHHCGVLGCCVNGGGFRGNMWIFIGLICMAAVGLSTTVLTGFLVHANGGIELPTPAREIIRERERLAAQVRAAASSATAASTRSQLLLARQQALKQGNWTALTTSVQALAPLSGSSTLGRRTPHPHGGERGLEQVETGGGATASDVPLQPLQSATTLAAANEERSDGGSSPTTLALAGSGETANMYLYWLCVATVMAVGVYALWRGLMWLFYHRYAHKRRTKPTTRRVA